MLLPDEQLSSVLGDRTAKALSRHLGLNTIADLLQHYPRRYSSRGELTPIAQLPIGEQVTVVAEVVEVRERRMKGKSGSILEIKITDGAGFLTLTFFNQSWRQKDLRPKVRGLFAGKIGAYQGKLQLAHPDYELFLEEVSPTEAKRWADLPIPIYPAASAISTWTIAKSIGIVLDSFADLTDTIPEEIRRESALLSAGEAIRKIHQPETSADWQQARETLKFNEAFLLQATLLQRRAANESARATSRPRKAEGFVQLLDRQLPFELTDSQRQVGDDIFADLEKTHPMNRLLQGEVGSGKTLVALRAMLAVADSDGQSALLAPTEVLAAQHYRSIERTLGEELAKKLGLTLLTGQMPAAERKKSLLQIVSGKAQLVVGTHALLAEKVEFFDLGLVIVDEQHRFGVDQRDALRLKGKQPPHVLTMTATPIPRTLAVTVFGDLDISSITELPKNRQPISSHVVQLSQPSLVARVWQRIAEEIADGRQAFVVCPRIDENDEDLEAENSEIPEVEEGLDFKRDVKKLAAAIPIAESLRQNPALANLKIAVLHGRMTSEEKSEVMSDFLARQIDLLVSTTVIEVGVDVPNASVMVVLDADRFGISQLHQLRGRVGRGEHPGLCLLLTSAENDSLALERVNAVAQNSDGFKLSEIDLELRREGDVLGLRQSGGRSSLRLLRVIADAQLIAKAREQVSRIFENDPKLQEHPDLAKALAQIEDQTRDNLAKV